jgi:hypothetical protein
VANYIISSKEIVLNLEEVFDRFQNQGFIKAGDRPVSDLSAAQKAILNRRGNELINRGDVESARRIFQTTGYSDGLARVGDKYLAAGKTIEALKMYWIAPDRTKAETIIADLAEVIRKLVKDDTGKDN